MQATSILRHGLAAAALLLPTFHGSVLSKQEAVSPKGGFPGCGTVDDSEKQENCLQLSFQGEVSSGKSFEQAIGGGLFFRLDSTAQGWTIEILPRDGEGRPGSEYVWVVTPPYHFGNQRYLDTSYSVPAREAVDNTPREFNFVLNEGQFKKAYELVELVTSSRPQSDQRSKEELDKESDEAIAALMKFPVAKGRLWIVDSKITKGSANDDLGSIDWIRFKVALRVPCDFAAAKSSSQFAVDGTGCRGYSGKKDN